MSYEAETDEAAAFLASAQTLRAFEADPYWPKWTGPWWRMLLLHEMGETARIPSAAAAALTAAMDRLPIKTFVVRDEDWPPGGDRRRDAACHCQVANVYRVLDACGVDVDAELPWIRPWLLTWQMADGGFNCDAGAYLATDECPSSMVGTIAAFEAVLMHTHRAWTPAEEAFLDRGAAFLMARRLTLGSPTRHNAEERDAAADWPRLCFPRFYLYDVLRGLSALTLWAERTGRRLPRETVGAVIADLDARFPDGEVRTERLAYDGVPTIVRAPDGRWGDEPHTAGRFPLLTAVSAAGQASPFLSAQWAAARGRIAEVVGD